MTNSKAAILLVSILAVASFLRLYSLDSAPPGLYADEAVNGNNAMTALTTGDFKSFYTENNGREGLFINIQALAISAFGNTVWPLRSPSAIFGILTVLGIYFLTRELFSDKRVALLAAFLIATSFWHINFSRIGFRAIMAPAFLTWGLYLLLLSFKNLKLPARNALHSNAGGKIQNWLVPILAGLVYGLGMHSYIAYRATPLLIVFVLWLLSRQYGWKPVLKKGVVFIAAAIIVFLPLGFYFIQNPSDFFGRTSQISIWQSPSPLKELALNTLKTAGMFNFVGDWNPRHNIPGAPLLYWPVGILFLIGLVLGIRSLFKSGKIKSLEASNKFASLTLLAWLIISALPVIISNEGLPHALRAILMAPAIFILAAAGGIRLYDFTAKKLNFSVTTLKTSIFILAAILFFQVSGRYFIDWVKSPATTSAFNNDIVEIGKEINRLPAETPKYVVIDTGGHNVREIGTPAQTLMYITDTYLPERQKEKNLHYISPEEMSGIPENSYIVEL